MCKCGNDSRPGQRDCLTCHATNMREFRATHNLTPEQKKKDNCRSYAGTYKRRGKLIQEPCEQCDSENSQMHHEDYDKPLEVTWLCRECHLNHHIEIENNALMAEIY